MIVRQIFQLGVTTLGPQQPVTMDVQRVPFQASVNIDLVSGESTYAVEFTTDDLSGDPAVIRWHLCPEATSTNFVLNRAVTGLRLNIQSLTGELRLAVIQGTGIGA